jgi:hypothetical protein
MNLTGKLDKIRERRALNSWWGSAPYVAPNLTIAWWRDRPRTAA